MYLGPLAPGPPEGCKDDAAQDGKIKGQTIPFPSTDGFMGVMGHECSGTVEAVGPGVTNVKVRHRYHIIIKFQHKKKKSC